MFVLCYLCIMPCLCLYGWWHLYQAFWKRHLGIGFAALALILLLAFLPILNRLIFHRETPALLEDIAWIYLALLFWFTATQIPMDIWNLLGKITRLFGWNGLASWSIPPFYAACTGLILLLCAILWGTVEARAIRLKTVVLQSEKIPLEAHGYKIALLSDLHFHHQGQPALVKKITVLLQEAQPDLLLSAGDFLDGQVTPALKECLMPLAEMEIPDGKFGVIGNHDCYSGAKESMDAHETAGIEVLLQKGIQLKPWLYLYGMPDPALNRHHRQDPSPIPENPKDSLGILLYHQPRTPEKFDQAGFDLMLSGHTHGGQIFPFGYLVKLVYPWKAGKLHTFAKGMQLYISPGTSFWGPPFRILARPEITIFLLERKSAQQ